MASAETNLTGGAPSGGRIPTEVEAPARRPSVERRGVPLGLPAFQTFEEVVLTLIIWRFVASTRFPRPNERGYGAIAVYTHLATFKYRQTGTLMRYISLSRVTRIRVTPLGVNS